MNREITQSIKFYFLCCCKMGNSLPSAITDTTNSNIKTITNIYGFAGIFTNNATGSFTDAIPSQNAINSVLSNTSLNINNTTAIFHTSSTADNYNAGKVVCITSVIIASTFDSNSNEPGILAIRLTDNNNVSTYIALPISQIVGDFNYTVPAGQCITKLIFTNTSSTSSPYYTLTNCGVGNIPISRPLAIPRGFNALLLTPTIIPYTGPTGIATNNYFRGVASGTSASGTFYLASSGIVQPVAPSDTTFQNLTVASPAALCNQIVVNRTVNSSNVVTYSYTFSSQNVSSTYVLPFSNVLPNANANFKFGTTIGNNTIITGLTFWTINDMNGYVMDNLLVACQSTTTNVIAGTPSIPTNPTPTTGTAANPSSNNNQILDFLITPIGIGISVAILIIVLILIYRSF